MRRGGWVCMVAVVASLLCSQTVRASFNLGHGLPNYPSPSEYQPPQPPARCQPENDGKVLCRCVDWTARPACTPIVSVLNSAECMAVGGVWGHDARRGEEWDKTDPECMGNWRTQPSKEDALILYNAVMDLRHVEEQREAEQAIGLDSSGPGLVPGDRGAHLTVLRPPAPGSEQYPPLPDEPAEHQDRSIILAPSYGPSSGGVWVQVTGAGSFHTPNSLTCKMDLIEQYCYSNHYYYAWCYLTPKCAGVYDFNCRNGPLDFHGTYAVVAKTPWITSVYPFSGDTKGGDVVTVRGWNFEPHCPSQLLCRFGTTVVPAKFYTSSSIRCVAPCNDKGFISVEVSNDGGEHWSMSGVQYGYVGERMSPQDLRSDQCTPYLADR